ncbi:MAG: S-methyl-5'-thioadenosine phosphorylase [Phycisphaerae bacterium]|nr:S-methyl-5'-thioadenosine phosphorylase [Phycisphaerae bacterium]
MAAGSDVQRLGIIGGSGLGQALREQSDGQWVEVGTPFGPPSDRILLTEWSGTPVAFISRHGPGHLLNPSQVPYRANIYALKTLGVRHLIASGATGSLREDIHPGELVVADQVIDKTFRRASTFFDRVVGHVEFADPFSDVLRDLLIDCASEVKARVHPKGTYVCMEGPQFSTRAESLMHRAWGGDLIGMTCMPEAKLAREAEICYALVALPTDYDCWRPTPPGESKEQLLSTIIGNLNRATEAAISLMRAAAPRVRDLPPDPACEEALKLAVWSDKSKVDPAEVEKLRPILGRYFQ